MSNSTFALLVRALILGTAVLRIAIVTALCSKSHQDIRNASQDHQTRTHNKSETCRKLQLCGDKATELRPAVESYTDTLNNLRTKKQNLEVFHNSAQSIRQHRLQLQETRGDLGPNKTTAITETWLNDTEDKTLWQLSD